MRLGTSVLGISLIILIKDVLLAIGGVWSQKDTRVKLNRITLSFYLPYFCSLGFWITVANIMGFVILWSTRRPMNAITPPARLPLNARALQFQF